MAVLNYTTNVPVNRTLSEVQDALVKGGASAVMANYEAAKPVGVAFTVGTDYGVRQFVLPVPDPARVLKLLKDNPGKAQAKKGAPTLEQAERVSWRILKDWLEAQLALISIDAVALDQVMLPYMTDAKGATVYELYRDRQLAIGPGSE